MGIIQARHGETGKKGGHSNNLRKKDMRSMRSHNLAGSGFPDAFFNLFRLSSLNKRRSVKHQKNRWKNGLKKRRWKVVRIGLERWGEDRPTPPTSGDKSGQTPQAGPRAEWSQRPARAASGAGVSPPSGRGASGAANIENGASSSPSPAGAGTGLMGRESAPSAGATAGANGATR